MFLMYTGVQVLVTGTLNANLAIPKGTTGSMLYNLINFILVKLIEIFFYHLLSRCCRLVDVIDDVSVCLCTRGKKGSRDDFNVFILFAASEIFLMQVNVLFSVLYVIQVGRTCIFSICTVAGDRRCVMVWVIRSLPTYVF